MGRAPLPGGGMRASMAAGFILELAFVAASVGMEDGASTTAVFDLAALVDDADGFAKGSMGSPAQTELERVEAMKKKLTASLLNKQIQKIPYTETELGEGMAITAVKGKKISGAYSAFKRLGKTLERQKNKMEKKMIKAKVAMTKAEKKELKTRKAAAELRKKLRKSVPKKKAAKAGKEAKRLKQK